MFVKTRKRRDVSCHLTAQSGPVWPSLAPPPRPGRNISDNRLVSTVSAAEGPPAFAPDPTALHPPRCRGLKSNLGGGKATVQKDQRQLSDGKAEGRQGEGPHVLGLRTSGQVSDSASEAATFKLITWLYFVIQAEEAQRRTGSETSQKQNKSKKA